MAGDTEDLHIASSWEWMDEPPTTSEVQERLKTITWYGGIQADRYVEFVQPLPQRKKIQQPGSRQAEYKEAWTLYVSVAGRIRMVNDAANENTWRVDFTPEPVTPTGIPGYLEYGDRIVYREYMEVHVLGNDGAYHLVGRKPGTAWVPGSGGSGAVQSNRFEKVETSARGRAIAAWGIGILPGSGVASYEEMQNAAELAAAAQHDPELVQTAKSKEDIEEAARLVLAEYQDLTGITDEGLVEKVDDFTVRTFNKKIGRTSGGAIDFGKLKAGEIALMTNAIKKLMSQIRAQRPIG